MVKRTFSDKRNHCLGRQFGGWGCCLLCSVRPELKSNVKSCTQPHPLLQSQHYRGVDGGSWGLSCYQHDSRFSERHCLKGNRKSRRNWSEHPATFSHLECTCMHTSTHMQIYHTFTHKKDIMYAFTLSLKKYTKCLARHRNNNMFCFLLGISILFDYSDSLIY